MSLDSEMAELREDTTPSKVQQQQDPLPQIWKWGAGGSILKSKATGDPWSPRPPPQ